MIFGTWNNMSLYRADSLTAAARELARFSGCAGGWVGQWGHGKSRGVKFYLWKKKQKSSIGNRIFCTPQNSISS
jgi:hypothetical protein